MVIPVQPFVCLSLRAKLARSASNQKMRSINHGDRSMTNDDPVVGSYSDALSRSVEVSVSTIPDSYNFDLPKQTGKHCTSLREIDSRRMG